MKIVRGAPKAVRAVATLVDRAFDPPLPVASTRFPCVCGGTSIVVVDYDAEIVRCVDCGKVTLAGARAATIQVRDLNADGSYDVDDKIATDVAAAQAKPDRDRSDDEKTLAAVTVSDAPTEKPVDPGPGDITPKETKP